MSLLSNVDNTHIGIYTVRVIGIRINILAPRFEVSVGSSIKPLFPTTAVARYCEVRANPSFASNEMLNALHLCITSRSPPTFHYFL